MVLAMVAERIKAMRAQENDTLERFSRGEISRRQAMRKLDISYSELLDRIATKGLELPRVSSEEAQRMGHEMNEILDRMRP